jgi:adenylylsulfate kinase-like enzyme
LSVVEERDPKGLYKKAKAGEIKGTGMKPKKKNARGKGGGGGL